MTDFALFRQPDGKAWLGEGPFEALPAAPGEGAAFYINDFDLSDPVPWKRPTRLHEISLETLPGIVGWNGAPMPRVVWAKPATEWFKMAFRRIRREVLARRLEKMVPVLTERGILAQGQLLRLLERVMTAPANTWGYASVAEGRGFLGATPELLFIATGMEIETMALAGTAKPGNQEAFLTDVKEIEEHELVVRYLVERLSELGLVRRGPRSICHTSGLMHFQSAIHVNAHERVGAGDLVKFLHPTPAVGCLPRDEHWLARLHEYREQLQVPGFFGAPFGFIQDGICQMVVAIRGLSWTENEVQLPSGCGIVGGSAFDHEWRELRLKREAVLQMLGL